MRLAPLVPLLLLIAADKDPYAKLSSLTVDQFARKMIKTDDDLTTSVTYSTKGGYQKALSTGGWLFGTQSDMWLRAAVDKRTGVKTYAVLAAATWVGRAQFFRSATYATPDGPKDAVATPIDNRLSTCISAGCDYTIVVGIDVDRATLQQAAEANVPWRFRFRSDTGAVFENALPVAEIKAMLAVTT